MHNIIIVNIKSYIIAYHSMFLYLFDFHLIHYTQLLSMFVLLYIKQKNQNKKLKKSLRQQIYRLYIVPWSEFIDLNANTFFWLLGLDILCASMKKYFYTYTLNIIKGLVKRLRVIDLYMNTIHLLCLANNSNGKPGIEGQFSCFWFVDTLNDSIYTFHKDVCG